MGTNKYIEIRTGDELVLHINEKTIYKKRKSKERKYEKQNPQDQKEEEDEEAKQFSILKTKNPESKPKIQIKKLSNSFSPTRRRR